MVYHETEILLVEDDPLDAELIMTALNRDHNSPRIRVLTDGAEAIEYLFATGEFTDRKIESIPRVIFLDLKLPRVGGLDVLQKIKTSDRTREIPVVMFSSSHEDSDIQESYQRGANSYVVKPMDSAEFVRTVSEMGHYWAHLNEQTVSTMFKVL